MQKYLSTRPTHIFFALIICYSLSLLSACSSSNSKKPLDTSGVSMKYQSIRFDKAFFNIDTNNLYEGLDAIGKKHPDFTNLFLTRLASFGQIGSPGFDTAVHRFLTHKDYRALWDTVIQHFPDTKNIDEELATTFKNVKYFYPEERLGRVYYFVSGLNLWSAITMDSAVGVGLDMYLGADFPFYASVQIPAYDTRNRVPERIPVDVARTIFEAKFPFEYESKNLLEMMLYKGKELYFSEQVCRNKADHTLIGYTPEHIQFCEEQEEGIYYFFIKQDALYSTTWQEIMPFVNDGPTTAGMPVESPGNIGSWLGWQIVRQYMAENPEVTLQELLSSKISAQQFLRDAKYKP